MAVKASIFTHASYLPSARQKNTTTEASSNPSRSAMMPGIHQHTMQMPNPSRNGTREELPASSCRGAAVQDAASRRRGRIYRSTREDSTTNGPRQQTRPRRVVVSNAADYKICGCGDALLSASFSFVGTYLVWREHIAPCESCLVCHKRSSVASSSTIDDGLPVVGVPTRAPGAVDALTILDTQSTRIGTVPWSARWRGLLLASRQLSTVGV